MEITERPPTRFDLPGTEEPVDIAAQRWALEVWEGEDPPGLAKIWARKPKFAVNGSRSCAELGHRASPAGRRLARRLGELLRPPGAALRMFPAPALKTLAETGAPMWAVEIFDCLRVAKGGSLGGFFDVFAWREPGQVRFCEAKVGPDRIKVTQVRFLEVALRFHRPADFMVIEVAGPMPGKAGRRPTSAWPAVEQDRQQPMAEQLRSDGQGLLRRAARDLLCVLDGVAAPDEPERHETLRDLIAAVEARMKYRAQPGQDPLGAGTIGGIPVQSGVHSGQRLALPGGIPALARSDEPPASGQRAAHVRERLIVVGRKPR